MCLHYNIFVLKKNKKTEINCFNKLKKYIFFRLPIPWLFYFFITTLAKNSFPNPISVQSDGLLCSIGMLFFMLIILLIAIIFAHWQMNKKFGVVMIISYLLFCVISILLENKTFSCPLRVGISNAC